MNDNTPTQAEIEKQIDTLIMGVWAEYKSRAASSLRYVGGGG